MNNSYFKLFTFEFRKFWTLSIIIVAAIILLLILAGMIIPVIMGAYGDKALIHSLDFNITLFGFYKILVPLLALFFTTGIVAFDKRSHWLRTILSRPIKRENYLLIKMASSSASIFMLMLVMGTLPITILSLMVDIPIKFTLSTCIYIHLFFLLESMMYIAISTWLSCFLPSFLNVVVLAFWMFTDSSIIKSIVSTFLWDKTWAVILKDFYFPSGFSDALDKIITNASFPYSEIFWGIAALFGFLSLALYHFNHIQIDSGSD
jgi:ABC-type transport system involved in multi-copper enzyme maturation permease subunit